MERFWNKAAIKGPDECWPWLASTDKDGYGHFWLNGKCVQAHRVAFEIVNGPIPEGMEPDHRCHVPGCINPSHLRLATRLQNTVNTKIRKDNSTGYKGVWLDKKSGTYYARIRINGKLKVLGSFPNPEAAHFAYCRAAKACFGEFANFGRPTCAS